MGVDTKIRIVLGSFRMGDQPPFLGLVRDDGVVPLFAIDSRRFPAGATIRQLIEDWEDNLATIKAWLARPANVGSDVPITRLQACAPVPDARQVFCAGANYRAHVVEMVVAVGLGAETADMDAQARRAYAEAYVERQLIESDPFIFMKPVSSIAGPCEDLILPEFSDKTDWELELGVVIGRETFRVAPEEAWSSIAGYMIVNDLTARDRVRRTDPGALSLDWLAAKGAPGFLPTGPFLVPAEFILDPQNLRMRLAVNGEIMQDSSTSDMIFSVARQISFISRFVRMLPGDILCTGSPAGNGVGRGRFLNPGDVITAEIEGLGDQRVRCKR
jgi:2-keto-4-pentenoate hydratase/2-oxohepta-3-ene-1,7-dioic acid hydratase in catechol pathway